MSRGWPVSRGGDSYVPGVNPFRRSEPLPPDEAARQRALARLAAASGRLPRAQLLASDRAGVAGVQPAAGNLDGALRAGSDDSHDRGRSGDVRWAGSDTAAGGGRRSAVQVDDEMEEPMTGGWVPEVRGRDDGPGGQAPLERLRDARLSLSVRHVVVIALVLVVGIGWGVMTLLRSRPVPVSRPVAGIVTGSPVAVAGASAAPSARATLVVDVAGKVRRPGLVRTRQGARVADVLAAAGGALPGVDLSTLNLARRVADGEQILVGVGGPPPVAGTPVGPGVTGGQVDLNTATAAQLEELPGVGPVLAQRIVDWRTEHGRFSSVDELQEVSGVGEKKFADLRPHVRV
jgi:competence protein ComEA